MIISDKLLNEIYDIVEKRVKIKKQIKSNNILHKKHASKRETVCGIKYDNTIMHKFVMNQLAGHWRRVTCKNCLKKHDVKEVGK